MAIIKNVLLIPETGYSQFYQPHKDNENLFICVLCDKHSITAKGRETHFRIVHRIIEE